MEASIVARLLELNGNFYSQFASDFSATRPSRKLNLRHILPYVREGVKVLDIGCGNGRLAQRLDRENLHAHYVGVDSVPELIELARARGTRLAGIRAEFRVLDITTRGWANSLRDFDTALMLAALHHVPSFDLRAQVLREIRATLKPAGRLLMTNWKFDENERLRRKIVPWSEVGLDADALEPGDALITWKRGGEGLRYVHLITPDEVQRLAPASGLSVLKQFYADAGLNLYSALALG